ncbi:oxidoreductase [Paenibacillus physcomitrellae]|uniref:Short-chain dehydrogenase/reductase n=1 Tax=Paenibacillus physcomitrellae TaxID=1619311 RepID=A0ABQ1FPV9_9BACL|nr:oxidoreductase [Paenibacillus physcomitrellae]GGA23082.1 short-chain dehydrogenase/reductase [Paenibacillus physcomitrellae]
MSKVWFVTGSSRGLGRALAEEVLKQGHKLFATARRPEQLNELVQRYPGQVETFALDVTNKEQVKSAVQKAVDVFGRIDVLVNNAGYGNIASIEEITDEDLRAQIETNLFGVINVTQTALPVLRKQREGHILQLSSIGGRIGSPGLGAYQTAKWAVEGFSEVLAGEIKHLGIKVTIIEPSGFRTDWAGSSMSYQEPMDDYKETVGKMHELVRQGSGKQDGDPVRAAKAMITIVGEDNPPLRLLLGKGAVQMAKQVDQAKLAETEKWEALSISADFPE